MTRRSLITTDDLSDDELGSIVERGVLHATGRAPRSHPLAGDVVGVYFEKTSTRTRTAFSVGALRLGAGIVTYGPGDLQTNTGESIVDTGTVLARMLDILVARTSGRQDELAGWVGPRMAVLNAMTAEEHPTQALADLTTLRAHFGALEGLRVCYVGEGNNTAAALALTLPRFSGTELELRTPPGYGLSPDILARAAAHAARCGASVHERHDLTDVACGVDAIYTTRWQTTGTTKADPDWRDVFAPFQVTRKLWVDNPAAVFMHDLPAHRGEEVTAEVLDGPRSIALNQAENKLHSAMAVLEWSRGRC